MVLETGKSPGDFLDGKLLLHVIEHAPVGFGLQDADGNVTYANRCLLDMLGFTEASEMCGRQVESLVVEEERPAYRALREQRESGQLDLYSMTLQRTDGGRVRTLISPVIIQGPDGELRGSAGFVMDVSQLMTAGGPSGTAAGARLDQLTAREREVFDYLIDGKAVREIGEVISISEHTVRNHIKSIYRKLGLHSRLDLVRAVLGN